jgi:CheY-like chemotaxis protein
MDAPAINILAIDDEPTNLLLATHALRRLGYPECVREEDPRRGIKRFRTEKFDLVLLDLNMPGMTGCRDAILAIRASQLENDAIPC